MSEKKYVDGFRWFDKKPNQPDFVKGAIVLTPVDLMKYAEDNEENCSQYKGKLQIRFQVKQARDGRLYAELDTYKPGAATSDQINDLPF